MQLQFYKLVPLIYGNATGHLEAIKTELTRDGLWDVIQEKMIALVTGMTICLPGMNSLSSVHSGNNLLMYTILKKTMIIGLLITKLNINFQGHTK